MARRGFGFRVLAVAVTLATMLGVAGPLAGVAEAGASIPGPLLVGGGWECIGIVVNFFAGNVTMTVDTALVSFTGAGTNNTSTVPLQAFEGVQFACTGLLGILGGGPGTHILSTFVSQPPFLPPQVVFYQLIPASVFGTAAAVPVPTAYIGF